MAKTTYTVKFYTENGTELTQSEAAQQLNKIADSIYKKSKPKTA